MRDRVLKSILIALLSMHFLALGLAFYLTQRGVYRQRHIPEESRLFEVPEGSSVNQVLARLRDKQLAPASSLVRLALIWEHKNIIVRKGTYQLPENASTIELLKLFEEGKSILCKVTIPEGWDRWQIARTLVENRLGTLAQFHDLIEDPAPIRHLDPDATSLEGYLFPETYLFSPDAAPGDIIATMLREFELRTEGMRKQLAAQGGGLNQWVTLASLVEKETSVLNERPTIAGVFNNRIRLGMLLQCDPTIIYSLKLADCYRGKIYKSDILFDHPYNTYVFKGLPPGPIASPSLSSLSAAIEPEETRYLFFVAKGDGSHYFSGSLNEHNRAVSKFRRN